jgi:hypothetical protein
MVVVASVAVAGMGVSSVACVSSETTPASGAVYPTKSTFCDQLAKLVCNDTVVRACYGSDDSSLVADTESCVDAFKDQDLCMPSVDYHNDQDDTQASACLSAWRGVYSDGAIEADELAEAEETCLAAFHDAGAAGSDCIEDSECDIADSLRCVVKPGATGGTCQEPEEMGGGHECAEINQTCAEGFYCDPSGNCLARENIGDPCSSEILCVEEANCSAPVDGVCEAKLPNNETCQRDLDCANGLCNKGTGDTDGLCAGRITLNQTSAACDIFR